MALLPPARADGMSAFIGVPTLREAFVASFIAVGLALILAGVGLTGIALAVAAIGAGAVSPWLGGRFEAKRAMFWARPNK